ncbi:unnamed protein product [Ixodes pacificus]
MHGVSASAANVPDGRSTRVRVRARFFRAGKEKLRRGGGIGSEEQHRGPQLHVRHHGAPQGVEVSHYGFVANLHTSKNCLSSEDTDVLLAWNPITHASGFLFTMMAACTGSTCVVTSPALSFEKFVDLVNEHNVRARLST